MGSKRIVLGMLLLAPAYLFAQVQPGGSGDGVGLKGGVVGGSSGPLCVPPTAVYRWTPNSGCSTSVACAIDQVSGNNAFQTTSANLPTYNATGTPSGKPSLTFNGTSARILPTTPIPANPTAFTLYAIIKPSSVTVNSAMFGGVTGGIEYRINSSANPDLLVQSVADVGSGTQTLSAGAWTTQIVTFTNSSIAFFSASGGVLSAQGSGSPAATSFTSTTNELGGASVTAEFFHGDIAEWGYISSANTASIAVWSSCRYGI